MVLAFQNAGDLLSPELFHNLSRVAYNEIRNVAWALFTSMVIVKTRFQTPAGPPPLERL